MEDYKLVSTPMITGCKLCVDDGSTDIDQRLYRSMIGSLLYLTTSRPDIMFGRNKDELAKGFVEEMK